MSFLLEHFCLNIHYGNILLHFGLEGLKIHKTKKNVLFLPACNKFASQNNPLMQLHLMFHKTLIKTNGKSDKFKVVDLIVF